MDSLLECPIQLPSAITITLTTCTLLCLFPQDDLVVLFRLTDLFFEKLSFQISVLHSLCKKNRVVLPPKIIFFPVLKAKIRLSTVCHLVSMDNKRYIPL